ncbi:MAG: hypothetical protein AABX14_02375 [Candidatus Aenigmatarchaeota archaeon]
MDVIMDTNIASTFGKIERFDLLEALFPDSTLFISSSVQSELSAEKWLKLAKKVIKTAKTTGPTKPEAKLTEKLLSKRNMGKAEAECIAIAKSRGMLLLTNDKIAVKEARKAGADLMDLRAIVRHLWKQNVLSKEAAESLITEIEEKDNIIFVDKEKIFLD